MNELRVIERDFEPLLPQLRQALASTMPAERLVRTVLTACERTPKLLQADRQSLFNAAMTFAVLGLEVDGVTGQGFLIPFVDRKNNRTVVQPIIGYKGYNTLAARAGYTITAGRVREEDHFDFQLGSNASIVHRPKLCSAGRTIAFWAVATSPNRTPIPVVMSIDEVMAVQAKSPRGREPPWSDPDIGFPAMGEKTARRRLSRSMPLTVYQMAARMEEAFEEQQKHAWIGQQGVVVEGDILPARHNTETPTAEQLTNPPTLEQEAMMAAERGKDAFRVFCGRLTKAQYLTTVKPRLAEFEAITLKADNNDGNISES